MLVLVLVILMVDISMAYAASYQVKDAHFTVRMPENWTKIDQETFSWLKNLVGAPNAKLGFFYDSEEPELRVSPVVLLQWQDLTNPGMIRFVSRAQEEYRKVARICDSYSAPNDVPKFCLDPKNDVVSKKTTLQGKLDGLVVHERYYLGRDERIMGVFFISHDSDRPIVSNLVAPIVKNSGFNHGYGYIRKWRIRSNLAIISLVLYIGVIIWLFWFMYIRSRSKKYASLDLIDYDSVQYEAYKKQLFENRADFSTGFLEKCLLEVVTRGNRPDLIDLLRSMGANLNHKYPGDISILMCACASQTSLDVIELLCRDIEEINEADTNGMTALHYAIANRAVTAITELLIDNGADVNLADRSGLTPLMHACKVALTPELIEVLIEGGASSSQFDSNGRNAFSYAIKNRNLRNLDVIRKLVDSG